MFLLKNTHSSISSICYTVCVVTIRIDRTIFVKTVTRVVYARNVRFGVVEVNLLNVESLIVGEFVFDYFITEWLTKVKSLQN